MSRNALAYLSELLINKKFENVHVEVGTAAGGSLKHVMQLYQGRRMPRFIVVDPMTYFDKQLQTVKKNLLSADLPLDRVKFYIKKSASAYKEISRQGIICSFVLIDGAHKMKQVTQDLRFADMLEKGGVLCLDDYSTRHVGVKIAVDRFLERNQNFRLMNIIDDVVFIEKVSLLKSRAVTVWDVLASLPLHLWIQWSRSVRKRL